MNMTYNLQDKGSVYAANNPSMKEENTNIPLTKIGRTGKADPMDRIKELSKPSGVPTDFIPQSITKTPANRIVEKLAHEYYAEERINPKKEFFTTPAQNATTTIQAIANDVEKHSYVLPAPSCPLSEEDKANIINSGYIPNDCFATPFSDAVYMPDKNDCPNGLSKEKWNKTIESINSKIKSW